MTSTDEVVQVAVRLSRQLPRPDVEHLASALLRPNGLTQLGNDAGVQVRAACVELQALAPNDASRNLAAGALLGALAPDPAASLVTPVWTGPPAPTPDRLTSAVVVDLISGARSSLLLVGYAVHNEPTVTTALVDAAARGVSITLVLERSADNPQFRGSGSAFPGLKATRLCWPRPPRSTGASLHAKLLVIDDSAALVGSANITGAALGNNLECGVLITGGATPLRLRTQIDNLVRMGHLQPSLG